MHTPCIRPPCTCQVELALQFFLRLLGHSRQPADRQQTFMKEFSNILHLNPQHASLPALPVPRFGNRTIKVLLPTHHSPLTTHHSPLTTHY